MPRAGIGEALPHVDRGPVGFILDAENGFNVRRMGDTGVFRDMRLMGDMYRHAGAVPCSLGLVTRHAAHAVAGACAEVRFDTGPQPLRRLCLPRLTCAHPLANVLLDLGQTQTAFSGLPPDDPPGPVLD